MKTLLQSIQALLRTLPDVRRNDVFLSADKNLVQPGSRFPCIGIKDGKVTRSHLAGGVTEYELPVEIHIYEQLGSDDRAILSVFDITAKVHGLLQDNDLNGAVKDVTPGEETPVALLYRKHGMVLRKTLYYQYEREDG